MANMAKCTAICSSKSGSKFSVVFVQQQCNGGRKSVRPKSRSCRRCLRSRSKDSNFFNSDFSVFTYMLKTKSWRCRSKDSNFLCANFSSKKFFFNLEKLEILRLAPLALLSAGSHTRDIYFIFSEITKLLKIY